MSKSKVPGFQGPRQNPALSEYIRENNNPVHNSHVRKTEELKSPKTKFNLPDQKVGVGNPWLEMQKGKK